MSARQFHQLRATSLYCAACGEAMPVRERLLLILPEKELYEYQCTTCNAAVGTREVSAAEQVMRREAARESSRSTRPPVGRPGDTRGPQVRIL